MGQDHSSARLAPEKSRAVAYLRVSTKEQGDSHLGLDAQQRVLSREAVHRGWALLETYQDVASGKTIRRRPGLEAATALLRAGHADILLVSKLDRLSRSVGDFAAILERARSEGWAVVALDVAVDTTTAAGEMIANVLMVLAQWERRLISERTSAALQEKKVQGARLGRPPSVISPEIMDRAWEQRVKGRSLRQIAADLPAPGPGGGPWSATAVRRLLKSLEAVRDRST